jgi:hypothetical protein
MKRFILALICALAVTPVHAIQKNVASQKLTVFAYDSTTNAPKTGDAANLTAYVSIDDGTVTAITDTSAAEKSSTNAPGYYTFDLTQAETNGNKLGFSAKSSTGNVVVLGSPPTVYTVPPNYQASVISTSGYASTITRGPPAADLPFSFSGSPCYGFWDAEYSQKWEDEDQTGAVTNTDTVGWLQNLADAATPFTQATLNKRPQYLTADGLYFQGGATIPNLEAASSIGSAYAKGPHTLMISFRATANTNQLYAKTSGILTSNMMVNVRAAYTTELGTVRGRSIGVNNHTGTDGVGPAEVTLSKVHTLFIIHEPVQLGNGSSTALTRDLTRTKIIFNGTLVYDQVGDEIDQNTATAAYLGYNGIDLTQSEFYLRSLVMWGGALTNQQVNEVNSAWSSRFDTRLNVLPTKEPTPSGLEVQTVWFGDSNVWGAWSYGPSMSIVARDTFGPRNMRLPYNLGVFGITIAQTDVSNVKLLRSAGKTVAVYQVVTNSLASGVSAATAWSAAKVQIQSLLDQGVDNVIVWEPTDRTSAFTGGVTSGTYATAKAAYIALMDADLATIPIWNDALNFDTFRIVRYPCGTDANATFNGTTRDMGVSGASNASTDTDWWTDGAHANPSLQEFHGLNHADMIHVIVGDTTNKVSRLANTNLDAKVSERASQVSLDDAQTDINTLITINNALTADMQTALTNLATVDTVVDSILVDTAEIGTAGAGLTNINLPNQTMDIVGSITGSLSGSVGSVTSPVSLADGAITAAKIGSDAFTAVKFASDVTTELQNGLATASALSTVDGILDNIFTGMELDGSVYRWTTNSLEQGPTGSGASAETIADAVWDELQSGHVTAGSFGAYLDSAVSGVSTGGVSAGDIADAVWDESLVGHATAGTAGKSVSDTLVDTNELQADWANGGRLDLILDARASQSTVDDIDNFVDTEINTLLTNVGNLPSDTENATAVWANGTRLLTAGTNIVLAKGVGVTGFNDLDAAGIRGAMGLAAADLDTQLDEIESGSGLDAAETRAALGLSAANLDAQLADLPTNDELDTALEGIEVVLSPSDLQDIIDGISAAFTVAVTYVEDGHIWRFTNVNDTYANNTIYENVGFDGLMGMNFSKVIPQATSIASVTATTVTLRSGEAVTAEITLGTATMTADKKSVHLPVEIAEAGEYVVSITILTVDSQTFTRKGRLIVP